MYLNIINTSAERVQEAETYFSLKYVEQLKGKESYPESIIARHFIAKEIWENYIPNVDSSGLPIFGDKNLWSVSHKNWVAFVWVSRWEIGIDIEIMKPRDDSLFITFRNEEYEVLWGKDWENFYTLWTAIESIIKYERLTDYVDGMYKLIYMNHIEENIWGVTFQKRLIFQNGKKKYEVFSSKTEKLCYSICNNLV